MNEIQTQTKGDLFKLHTLSITEMLNVAKMFCNEELVPKIYRGKPANMVLAWAKGASLGLDPMTSLESISVINGQTSVWGDAILAICMRDSDFIDVDESWTYDEKTGKAIASTCTMKRRGREPVTRTFTLEMAKNAQLLTKNNWMHYPDRMLQRRARGWAAADLFPDKLKGIIMAEEAQDYPPEEKDVTPKKESINKRLLNMIKKQEDIVEVQPETIQEVISEEITIEESTEPTLLSRVHELLDKYQENWNISPRQIFTLLGYDPKDPKTVYRITKEQYKKLIDLGLEFDSGEKDAEIYFYEGEINETA